MSAALLAISLLVSPASAGERSRADDAALILETEAALWDDHADVRDAGFMLARARIDVEALAAELGTVLDDRSADAGVRARAALLLGRLGPSPRAAASLEAARQDPSAKIRSAARAARRRAAKLRPGWSG